MAQKEDILEQIVEEYLMHKGYFVQHNVKYRPDKKDPDFISKKDSVHSDIDVLAINPNLSGARSVFAVNVKSWQEGFDFGAALARIDKDEDLKTQFGRLTHRELTIPKWSRAFMKVIESLTGAKRFTHVLAVTLGKGDKSRWEENPRFLEATRGNPLRVLTLKEMVEEIEPNITRTPAATDIGRTLQLFRAAGLRPKRAKPETSVILED